MKYYLLTLIVILLISCEGTKKNKKYFPNGNLKSEAVIDNGKYNGEYKEYYEDGTVRIQGNFEGNLKQGLFKYYYKPSDRLLRTETLWRNDTPYYQKNIGKSSRILSEGALSNNRKVDKWKFYDENEGYIREVQEFFIVNGSSYLNQNWLLNKEQDTLAKGNHYEMLSKDTLNYDQQRIYFFLKQPYFSYDSDFFVCIPRNDEELEDDFSNENTIKWDTIESLAKRFRNQGKYKDRNHDVVFDLDYLSAGNKRLRGVLIEKQSVKNDTSNYDFVTRKIYFDKELYIREKQID